MENVAVFEELGMIFKINILRISKLIQLQVKEILAAVHALKTAVSSPAI